jgi:hypothetical protein
MDLAEFENEVMRLERELRADIVARVSAFRDKTKFRGQLTVSVDTVDVSTFGGLQPLFEIEGVRVRAMI